MNNSTNMDYTSLINILNKIKLYKENRMFHMEQISRNKDMYN